MTKPGAFTTGDVLAAADMNGLPGGLVATVVPGLVTGLGTSETDVSGGSITFTAVSGRTYEVTLQARAACEGSSGLINVWIADGSNNRLATAIDRREPDGGTGTVTSGYASAFVTAVGSTTVKIRAQRESANTMTITSARLSVRDLGPTP